MKYYSEETVKKIIAHAGYNGIFCVREPINLGTYSSIELPDKYGRLIDADECGKVLFDKYTEGIDKWDDFYSAGFRYALKYFSQAPTIVEATK